MKKIQLTHCWKNRVAVITGASSGIGAATARRLAAEGLRVVLAARRKDRLSALADEIRTAGGQADIIEADLAQDADRNRLFTQVVAAHGGADVLVNNAGLGWYGYASEMNWATAAEIIQVNIAATVQLSLLFLRKMRERKFGRIINVGSISGSLPSQGVAIYGASKAFMDNFTTALHRELRGTNIRASVLRAGPVLTEFCHSAAARPHGFHVPTERMGVTAERVAQRIWQLLLSPRRVVYIPRWLAVTPWVEASFGWLIDLMGPLLLKKQSVRG